MNEIVRDFLLETQENLAQLDLDLVALEKDPGERETLARAFRALHTVKGTAGFLGLPKLQAIAHAAEGLLSRLREGDLIFNPTIAGVLLAVVDAIRRILDAIEKSENEGSDDFAAIIQALERLRTDQAGAGQAHAPLPEDQEPQAPDSSLVLETSRVAEGTGSEPPDRLAAAVSDSSIRVDVGLLDKLMTLVGELVLTRNEIVQFGVSQKNSSFQGTVQKLSLLTTELQAGVMKTRLQPIGKIWSKFPRLVRDVAVACGKEVRLEMDGRETELDKTLVEAMRDPLTHLVRNAIDHGIEPPAERRALGKPAEGRLRLHAFHEGGKVIIEIADDGGGIDPQRIRDRAVKARLVTVEQAARLSDPEVIDLIFLPGLSTADKVTQFSGRGVGMDVVRTNIESIGGTVDIESRPGRGTTVTMKVPLTLAIVPALIVSSAGERYAIPQVSLMELVRLEGTMAGTGIEEIQGAPVYRLRGSLLPLVYLDGQLGVAKAGGGPTATGAVNIVVLQADDRLFGLVVDDIHNAEEIVVKPLQKQLKGIAVFSGATIMGDGKVALILDVLGLAQRARVVSGARERALGDKAAAAPAPGADRQTVLVFAAPNGERMAIPLSQVARLEEVPRSAVERVGAQDVIQYRGEILPLLHVSRLLRRHRGHGTGARPRRPAGRKPSPSPDAAIPVVVYARQGQPVGLVVGSILDIAEEAIVARARSGRPGVAFTAVIQGRVTQFLDIEALLRSADPDYIEPAIGAAADALGDQTVCVEPVARLDQTVCIEPAAGGGASGSGPKTELIG